MLPARHDDDDDDDYEVVQTGHWHKSGSARQWPEKPGFNPRSSHTKDSKNST